MKCSKSDRFIELAHHKIVGRLACINVCNFLGKKTQRLKIVIIKLKHLVYLSMHINYIQILASVI